MRSGIAVHLVLVTVTGKDGSNLDAQKREKIMANLEDSIRHSLRRGDSAARCSASQYVIMLPRANYENSCMVCERVLKAYYRDHSRLDADLRYEVFPIQPDEKENMQWMH
jgi:GGDEF domain-containing protein